MKKYSSVIIFLLLTISAYAGAREIFHAECRQNMGSCSFYDTCDPIRPFGDIRDAPPRIRAEYRQCEAAWKAAQEAEIRKKAKQEYDALWEDAARRIRGY